MRRLDVRAARWGLALLLAASLGGLACKDRSRTGALTPPSDAEAWESKYARAFDDGYTKQDIRLQGRAPHDVLDQRLFAARLGHADVVALVDVRQVWGRGRYQGRQDQYLEVEFDEVLLGELVQGTDDRQLLRVLSEDDLPGKLQGQSMLLFLRWAPEQEPPFHHHLMPAHEEAIVYIRAMIEHAQAEGVLDAKGRAKAGGGRRKKRRRDRKAAEGDG